MMGGPNDRRMTLAQLLDYEGAGGELQVCGITTDSRKVEPGFLFIAVAGQNHDGRDFITDAVAHGAVAVVMEGSGEDRERLPVPVIEHEGLAASVGTIAARFYGDPSMRMRVIGVTGTNGKSTVTHLLAALLAALGYRCGIIGTLGAGMPGALRTTGLTTPDAVMLQVALDALAADGCEAVAMEVSSHALVQRRVAGTRFETAVFTNLSRDHLDYHGDMASYRRAKRELFESPGLAVAVINVDDPFGRSLAVDLRGHCRVITYGLSDAAEVRAGDLHFSRAGVSGWLYAGGDSAAFHCPLLGGFNVVNLLAAAAVLCVAGVTVAEVAAATASLTAVPGRMEVVGSGEVLVIVDYAHTPDALGNVLGAVRHHTDGRLWVVFGCGGDRDRGKRRKMGAIAAAQADCVIVTSDNPRSEDPAAIIDDIVAGMPAAAAVRIEPDRGAAIAWTLNAAAASDAVVIAGKGHEDYQEIAGVRRPFSDIACAKAILAQRAEAP